MKFFNIGDIVSYCGNADFIRGSHYIITDIYYDGCQIEPIYKIKRKDGSEFKNIRHSEIAASKLTKKAEEDLLKEFKKMIDDNDKLDLYGFGDFELDFDTPPPIPSDRKPKDGDPIDWHKDHNVVQSAVGLAASAEKYWYCRDCKVEVKQNTNTTNLDLWD